jgi:hypothetical protein
MRVDFLTGLLPSRDCLTTSFVREFPGNAVLCADGSSTLSMWPYDTLMQQTPLDIRVLE